MGQVANPVVVGCPHHITRGGNQRQQATLSGSFAESRSLLFFQLEVALAWATPFQTCRRRITEMGLIAPSTRGIFVIIIRLLRISQIFDFFP